MKKNQTIIYLFYMLLFLNMACSEDNEHMESALDRNVLEFITDIPVLQDKSETLQIQIKAGSDWTIKSEQPWCVIQPSSGSAGMNTLTLTVEPNETTDERNTLIVLKTESKEKRTTISQKQKDALFLTSAKAEVTSDAQTVEVEVNSNIAYDYHIEGMGKEWITESKSRGLKQNQHCFNLTENTDTESRIGKIVFKGDDFNEVFTIFQHGGGPQLILSEKEYIVDCIGTDIKVELKSNTDYQMALPEVDWIHESKSRAFSSYTHFITVDRNETYEQRSAEVKFVYGELVENIKIIQKQEDVILLAKDSYQLNATKQELRFKVSSNVDYNTEVSVDWITLMPESKSLDDKELRFIVNENTKEKAREGEIIFSSDRIKQTVKVKQEGAEKPQIILSKKQYNLNAKKQTLTIQLKSNTAKYAVKIHSNWIKEDKSRTMSPYTHNFTIDENTTQKDRKTDICFVAGDQIECVAILQRKYFAATDCSLNFWSISNVIEVPLCVGSKEVIGTINWFEYGEKHAEYKPGLIIKIKKTSDVLSIDYDLQNVETIHIEHLENYPRIWLWEDK